MLGAIYGYQKLDFSVWYKLRGGRVSMEEIKNYIILLLGMYPKESKARIQRDTCTPMSVAALVTIAKR